MLKKQRELMRRIAEILDEMKGEEYDEEVLDSIESALLDLEREVDIA